MTIKNKYKETSVATIRRRNSKKYKERMYKAMLMLDIKAMNLKSKVNYIEDKVMDLNHDILGLIKGDIKCAEPILNMRKYKHSDWSNWHTGNSLRQDLVARFFLAHNKRVMLENKQLE